MPRDSCNKFSSWHRQASELQIKRPTKKKIDLIMEDLTAKKHIGCEFNMDTVCVELKYSDGSMIAIDAIAVENEVADNIYE